MNPGQRMFLAGVLVWLSGLLCGIGIMLGAANVIVHAVPGWGVFIALTLAMVPAFVANWITIP